MPLVSIIVPIYNVEPYLSRCIDSILAQTFADFELILVDDGSPDRCPAICDEYAQKDVRIRVVHKKNGGLSSARNAGMEIAQGKYYLFCDSDDYVSPNWCAHLLSHTTDEQDNYIFCGFIKMSEHSVKSEMFPTCVNESPVHYQVSDYIQLQANGKTGFAWNVLYYADILQEHKIRFSQEVIIEDLPFNLEYLRYMSTITYTGHPDYYYIQYDRTTLSRKYYPNGFKRWQEKYRASLDFITDVVPQEKQVETQCILATSYRYYFLHALDNTFDKRNSSSFIQKIRLNTTIVNSKEFQHCLNFADTSCENPRYIAFLENGNYICAYLLQVIAKQKNRLKRSR